MPADLVRSAERYAEVIRLGGSPFDESRAVAAGAEPGLAHEVALAVAELGAAAGGSAAVASCAGRTGLRSYSSWWQGTVVVYMFNSCVANGIKAALAAGGALVSLVLVFSGIGAPVAPIAAAIFALGSSALAWCTRNGSGLEIHQAFYGSWCTNQ